jgi:hypothetical protein
MDRQPGVGCALVVGLSLAFWVLLFLLLWKVF